MMWTIQRGHYLLKREDLDILGWGWHPTFHWRVLFVSSRPKWKAVWIRGQVFFWLLVYFKSMLETILQKYDTFIWTMYIWSIRCFSLMEEGNGLLSYLKSVKLRYSQRGGWNWRWEMPVLEELGSFASSQHLEPIPAHGFAVKNPFRCWWPCCQ